MPEESHSFAKTRVRLEEIVSQVRKKDTSLENSLDLLEEGVRLANQCTELIDHADWEAAMPGTAAQEQASEGTADSDGETDTPEDNETASDGATAQADDVTDGESSHGAGDR